MNYKIPNFLGGYNMAVEENSLDVNETINAQNVDISYGDLRTIAGSAKYIATAISGGIVRLMKHYHNNLSTGAVTSYLLASSASTIQYWNGTAWITLATGLSNGNFDYINYQNDSTDIIIMGNGTDVLKKWNGTTFANLGGTPPVVKSLGLHYERVWGTGDKANPNRVYYSDDFDPENWTEGTQAAGFLDIPTWDGGVCIGLSTIFDDVVIFKTNNIFRILGTYPGNYQVKKVYSTVGAIAEKTIVSSSDMAFFLAKDGVYYYDGVSTNLLLGRKLKFTINASYQQNAVSIIFQNKMYVAFPEGSSTTNNAILVYDLINKNAMIIRGLSVTDFIEFSDKLLFTNSTGYVYQLGTGTTFDGTAITAYYETPFTDLGSKNTTKSADTLYFYAEGTGSLQVDLTFDTKTKTKTVTLAPAGKMHTIPVNIEGRKLKMKFSNVSGSNFVISSPELTLEVDED